MRGIILIILDGYGIAAPSPGNAIWLAKPSFLNSLEHMYPHTKLRASGESVGLPTYEVGSTEVGHLNIGAGRIVYQNLLRINQDISDGTFYTNPAFTNAITHIKKTKGNLHLLGLIGEQYVHASIEHLRALLNFCKINSIPQVYLHLITDGRDSPPKAASQYFSIVDEMIAKFQTGKIASIMGRYFAMDRDSRWERTQKAYDCLTKGSDIHAESWRQCIEQSYLKNTYDEFIEPTTLYENSKPLSRISKGDAVIFYNFRIDRPRQLTKAFVLDNFESDANIISFDPYATKYTGKHTLSTNTQKPFVRGPKISDLYFVTMTQYQDNLSVDIAYPMHKIVQTLGKVLEDNQQPQLRIAESEKERFVTFYFNGYYERKHVLEDWIISPSPKVATYDLKPEMSAEKTTETLINNLRKEYYKFILINYANPDMVAHTGNIRATIQAISYIDKCVKKVVTEGLNHDYTILITADHGNAEVMIDRLTGEPETEHDDSLVPFYCVDSRFSGDPITLEVGILADIAPTILHLLNINPPSNMTGRNLIEALTCKIKNL